MTGPQDPAAAGRDQLRAGHADREQVIEALKGGCLDRAEALPQEVTSGPGGC